MNKKDLVPVIILALMIPLWMLIDRTFIAPKYPATQPVATEQPAISEQSADTMKSKSISEINAVEKMAVAAVSVPEQIAAEEKLTILGNEKIELELTSLGAGIKSVTLFEYPELNEEDSPPVVLDFSSFPALAYDGLSGLSELDSFAISKTGNANSIAFSKTLDKNLTFIREISLDDAYLLSVKDRFINTGENSIGLPELRVRTGYMKNPEDTKAMHGVSILGVDSHTPSGGINFWGRKLNKFYKKADKPESIDVVPEDMQNVVVDWVAAKNKFFTQIISPETSTATMAVLSSRDMSDKGVIPVRIAAALAYDSAVIDAGETLERNHTVFIGPKHYSTLKDAGNNMEGVMEFETIGFFSWMNWLMEPSRRALLWTLNFFDGFIHSYGIAIILLTLLIRILFWPLTHKSTESMKRMQEIQPLVKALQAKHGKSDPQKLQQETMKLYKEHNVNPMGGCLPMIVQIPVFIALFTVLRNAIELRYSSFLWIADLSQPENLFAGHIPFVGALNILPILMSVSMIWQQKLSTPATAATPEQQQQQKMMMIMMPIMMLFFFYSMPSGLVLYWTTSNLLMIAQTGFRNVRKKTKVA